jgi:hypothetical protein
MTTIYRRESPYWPARPAPALLHQQGPIRFAPLDPDGDAFGSNVNDEANYHLSGLLQRPNQDCSYFTYDRDFDAGCEHTITLVTIIPERCAAPQVIIGERACPPVDCGGPSGYAELLKTFANPWAQDYAERLERYRSLVPKGYDPEVYNLAEVNTVLATGVDAMVKQVAEADDLDEEEGPKVIQFPKGSP